MESCGKNNGFLNRLAWLPVGRAQMGHNRSCVREDSPDNLRRESMEKQEKTVERLNSLEASLSYLQNDYDQLNETVLENTKRLEQLKLAVERLTARLEQSGSQANETRNLEDEKPPHY